MKQKLFKGFKKTLNNRYRYNTPVKLENMSCICIIALSKSLRVFFIFETNDGEWGFTIEYIENIIFANQIVAHDVGRNAVERPSECRFADQQSFLLSWQKNILKRTITFLFLRHRCDHTLSSFWGQRLSIRDKNAAC
jgi:hypothetical protein